MNNAPVTVTTAGFTLVPNVVARDAVAELSGVIDQRLEALNRTRSHGVRNVAALVPEVRELAGATPISSLVASVLGRPGRLVRSTLFDKIPGANWKVAWHQDLTIAVERRLDVPGFGPWSEKDGIPSVQPPVSILEGMITVRLHLDDCDEGNGPLRVIPGSHSQGRLSPLTIESLVASTEAVTCTAEAGEVLLMRPLLLHASSPSESPRHRRVVHLDFARSGLPGGLSWSQVA